MRLAPLLALLAALATTAAPSVADTIEAPAGSLLVAAPELGDPNFDHTVVLLLNHDDDGALGVVINRPYGKAPTDELLRKLGQDPGGITGQTELFYGGPVQAEKSAWSCTARTMRAPPRDRWRRVLRSPATRGSGRCCPRQGPGASDSGPGLRWVGDRASSRVSSPRAHGSRCPPIPALIFAADPSQTWAAAYARRGIEL